MLSKFSGNVRLMPCPKLCSYGFKFYSNFIIQSRIQALMLRCDQLHSCDLSENGFEVTDGF